jgi:hypothetical protein
MLSKSHDCLGAIGCVLICNECLHWYRQCHVLTINTSTFWAPDFVQ